MISCDVTAAKSPAMLRWAVRAVTPLLLHAPLNSTLMSGAFQEQDHAVAAWLFVSRAPPGEMLGAEQQIGGQRAIPVKRAKDGKSSCFTFGRYAAPYIATCQAKSIAGVGVAACAVIPHSTSVTQGLAVVREAQVGRDKPGARMDRSAA